MRIGAMRLDSLGGSPAILRHAALVPAVLLLVLHAVAGAMPPDPLHLLGIWDGGDYDSVIQPLVAALDVTSVDAGAVATPAGPRLAAARVPAPPAATRQTAPRPQPRAPPLA
jgi:hypothetical protein